MTPPPPPAANAGLDAFPVRVALLFVWLTGLVHGALMHAFAQNSGLILTAYALAALAALAVTAPAHHLLALAPTAVVVGCGGAIAAIVLTSPQVGTVVWLFDFASYPIALLIVRGRFRTGVTSTLLLISAASVWTLTASQPDPSWGRLVSGPFVAGVVCIIWLETLRRIVARETRARTSRERDEMLSSAAVAATKTYQEEFTRVARESETVLREIAKGTTLDEGALRQIRIIEGRIRDRLRAADLFHPRVAAAVDAARASGVHVLLIGSGRMEEVGIDDELADRIAKELATPGLESVTLRRLPPGRHATVSIVGHTTEGSVRAAFDAGGNPTEARTGSSPV